MLPDYTRAELRRGMHPRRRGGVLARLGRELKNRAGLGSLEQSVERIEQLPSACLFPRYDTDHGHAEALLQQRQVERDAAPPRLIEQIHAYQHPMRQREDLQHKRKTALQTRGVADHDDGLCLARGEKVPGQRFFGRAGVQRIGAGQVDQRIAPRRALADAGGPRDGLAGPVAGVLPKPCKAVEERAFADVRAARERHDGAGRESAMRLHGAPPSRETRICPPSASRRASTAPQTA